METIREESTWAQGLLVPLTPIHTPLVAKRHTAFDPPCVLKRSFVNSSFAVGARSNDVISLVLCKIVTYPLCKNWVLQYLLGGWFLEELVELARRGVASSEFLGESGALGDLNRGCRADLGHGLRELPGDGELLGVDQRKLALLLLLKRQKTILQLATSLPSTSACRPCSR